MVIVAVGDFFDALPAHVPLADIFTGLAFAVVTPVSMPSSPPPL